MDACIGAPCISMDNRAKATALTWLQKEDWRFNAPVSFQPLQNWAGTLVCMLDLDQVLSWP